MRVEALDVAEQHILHELDVLHLGSPSKIEVAQYADRWKQTEAQAEIEM